MTHTAPRRSPSLPWLAAVVSLSAGPAVAQPVTVTLGPAEALPGRLYAFNTNLLTETAFRGWSYDGPQLGDAVRALKPRGLRFPGGTIANNYLWREDSFSEPTGDRTKWAGEQLRLFRKIGRPYDLPGFAKVCARHELEPVWVLNVYEETPESVAALMKHLGELGLNVRAVEFGNEPYWDGRSFLNVWKYMEFCRPLAAALRKHDPAVKIGACFGPVGEGGFDYGTKWNAPLAKETWFDAAVHHDYYGGQGFVLEQGDAVPVEALLKPEAWVDRGIDSLRELMPDRPVWFTEWNLGQEGIKQWKNTGGELLLLAAVYNRLIERRDAVELAVFHQISGSNFGTFDQDEATGRVETTASFQFFRLLGAAADGATELRPVTFAAHGGPAGDLRGFATVGAGGARLFLLNRGAADRTLTLPAGTPGDVVRLTIACPPTASLPTSTPLATRSPVSGGAVILPGHSISLVGPASVLDAAGLTGGAARADAGENLFPRRPHLTLWHPPFARTQPRFTPEGVYAVDTAALRDVELAVVTMDLSALGLKRGGRYELEFEANAEPAGGLVVKLPEAAGRAGESESTFAVLSRGFTRHRFRFTHDPGSNDGAVKFVLPRDVLRKAERVSFRGFRVGPAG